MYGKYHDPRVYQHLVHTYSRVPYLDHEIFNVQNNNQRHSKQAEHRTHVAEKAIQRTREKSQQFETSIRDSRIKKQQAAKEFMIDLQKSQQECLQRQKLTWSDYQKEQEQHRLGNMKDQLYLQSLLKSNSTKAESRLTSVRRWI